MFRRIATRGMITAVGATFDGEIGTPSLTAFKIDATH